jgi:CRISPR-associated endonuclease/helicase Cas3
MNDMALAKSDGTTLIEHIDDCLNVFSALKMAVPMLDKVTGMSNMWELLFIAIYIHDFGKCHIEFQKVLQKRQNNWNNQRHELYSIPFINKLNVIDYEKELIQKIVLAHHKDFTTLLKKYKNKDDLEFEYQSKWSSRSKFHPDDFHENFKKGRISPPAIQALVKMFSIKLEQYNIQTDINFNNPVDIVSLKHPYMSIANETIRRGKINQSSDAFSCDEMYWQNLLLWGALKICDHYGSAKINSILTLNKNIHFKFLDDLKKKLNKKGEGFYSHQENCFNTMGHCILIAPTGTGKTEAAIGWLKKSISINQGRTFYILPYTASINAMHKRLSNDIDMEQQGISEIVGVQHGKLMQYLTDIYENDDSITIQITDIKEAYKKILPPIKIITPFQVLKFCFGIKNYEMGFVGLAGAKLIFDEIHAYDVITFAQIMVMLKYFIKHLKCEVFVMTATLPSFLLEKLLKILNIDNPIRADKNILSSLKRHQVIIKQGTIYDQLNDIISIIKQKDKRVIIVCNTVATAQDIYQRIFEKNIIKIFEIVLLHARFNGVDRAKKERLAIDQETRLLIGTQAIEVSLDIDYDTMFTEPAPIDALLQRFGRVNRKCYKAPCEIIICSTGGEFDKYIYNEQIVDRTIEVLKKVSIIEESMTQSMLDAVYPEWDEKEQEEYATTIRFFEDSLASLQPFLLHPENEETFYEQFSNRQVLPVRFLEEYRDYFEKFEFIEANQLLVSISTKACNRLYHNGLIEEERFVTLKKNKKLLSNKVLISKCKYTHEIGLKFEEQEEMVYDNFI